MSKNDDFCRPEVFEGGRSVRFGEFTLLDLFGTWREMGRQYGSLASSQLKEMYAKVFDDRLLKFGTKNRG